MTENVPNVPAGDGNTKSPAYRYCFTFNNHVPEDIPILEHMLKEHCKKFLFQEEKGEETGTIHLQGAIWLKSKKRLDWLKKNINSRIHWEQMRNEAASIEYCKKAETAAGVKVSFGFPRPIEVITELRPWQKDLETYLTTTKPDNRKIIWYSDDKGGMGKTAFVRYMINKYGSRVMFVRGAKTSDVMNMVFNHELKDMDICFLDVPRESAGIVSYTALECIKDGLIVNTKYETGYKIFNSPHLVVFANQEPDRARLSEDRWDVRTFD